MRVKPEILEKVIINTIRLDNLLSEIISIYFGAYYFQRNERDFQSSIEPRKDFHKFFLQEMGSYSKLKIIKEINNHFIEKVIFPKRFNEDFRKLYQIRNIFAHSLEPNIVDKITKKESIDNNWDNLYQEHKEAFNKVFDFLSIKFYNQDFIEQFL